MDPAEILRRIYAMASEGPGECTGREADGKLVWRGSFSGLLWEAHKALGLPQEIEIGFGE